MEATRLQALEELARRAFAEQDDALTTKLVVEYRELANDDRVHCWSRLTQGGVQELDFAKFVHRNLGELLLEVFKK